MANLNAAERRIEARVQSLTARRETARSQLATCADRGPRHPLFAEYRVLSTRINALVHGERYAAAIDRRLAAIK